MNRQTDRQTDNWDRNRVRLEQTNSADRITESENTIRHPSQSTFRVQNILYYQILFQPMILFVSQKKALVAESPRVWMREKHCSFVINDIHIPINSKVTSRLLFITKFFKWHDPKKYLERLEGKEWSLKWRRREGYVLYYTVMWKKIN